MTTAPQPTLLEEERRRRAQVSLWAYAYEVHSDPIVSDDVFDRVCEQVNLGIATDRPELDLWFRENFDPCTGSWVYNHPDLKRLEELYLLITEQKNTTLKKKEERNHA